LIFFIITLWDKAMHVLLIDGFNLVRRIYEARPHDDEAVETEVITSAAHSVTRALREHVPSHVCCLFDSHEPTWRHQLFPAYKANRKPTPGALLEAIPKFETAFLELGVTSICVDGYEADDVIATLAKGIGNKGGKVTILSTDKNFLQLLDDYVFVHDHFNDKEYSRDWVVEKYGVRHEQLIDYWALTGDSTNNIKGVPKIGPKTAQQLIASFKTLDTLLEEPPDNPMGKRIMEHKHDAKLSRQLVRLKTDIKLGINLNQLRYISKQEH
jgi:protein Xni